MDYLRLKPLLQQVLLAFFVASASCAATEKATPLLHCEVSYAGTTHVAQARPVADPYSVPSVAIGGRFYFKAVMVGKPAHVDYIKLYAYLDTAQQPLLVQQATYLPPFPSGPEPRALTGEQHVFAGPVERELMYQCTLHGVRQ